jgi:hypothetical protein
MSTLDQLTWSSLTTAINEMKSPNRFFMKLLFGAHQTLPTETIELSVLNKGRETAPFVKKNGAAVMVKGHDEKFQQIEAPNIRIKRPFTASELLFGRRPATVVFPSAGDIIAAVERHIAIDVQVMADLITNSEEYLASLLIANNISWAVTDRDVYKITVPVPAANNVTLGIFWDDADPDLPTPELDFLSAKRIISQAVGLGLTDCVLGQEASQAFIALMSKQRFMPRWSVDAGRLELQNQFSEDGVIYLGMFSGVRVWEYSRTVSVDGVDTSLVSPKYAEFFAVTPAAENVEYFGAIPDLEAFEGRMFQGERFSTSWLEKDPSVRIHLTHSRPLPWMRRPGSHVRMKVVSG